MPTVGNTDPDFMDRVEETARDNGVNIAAVVELRKAFGIEGDLLDAVAPLPTWEFTEREPTETNG